MMDASLKSILTIIGLIVGGGLCIYIFIKVHNKEDEFAHKVQDYGLFLIGIMLIVFAFIELVDYFNG